MRTLTALAAAATLSLAAVVPALACSGYKPPETAQTTIPSAPQQQTAQTPAPTGTLTAPTETASADAKVEIKAN